MGKTNLKTNLLFSVNNFSFRDLMEDLKTKNLE